MKNRKMKINNVLAILLSFVMIFSLSGSLLRAEGIDAWDRASYASLEDVPQDIIDKVKAQEMSKGFSGDAKLVFDAMLSGEEDGETMEGPVSINGDMSLLLNEDGEIRFIANLKLNMMGDEDGMEMELYRVNDPENPEQYLTYSRENDGYDDYYDFGTESKDDEESDNPLEELMDIEEISKFGDWKVLEDKGDSLETVLVMPAQALLYATVADDYIGDFEDYQEDEYNEIPNIEEALGVDELVLAFNITIEKDTGYITSFIFKGESIEEVINTIITLIIEEDYDDDEESPQVDISVKEFSFGFENMKYEDLEAVEVPQDLIDNIAAEFVEDLDDAA